MKFAIDRGIDDQNSGWGQTSEIMEQSRWKELLLFGLTAQEVDEVKAGGYSLEIITTVILSWN
jgi:hypothetical protein